MLLYSENIWTTNKEQQDKLTLVEVDFLKKSGWKTQKGKNIEKSM